MADIKLKPRSGVPITLMTTELDALAASTGPALSSAIDVDADYDLVLDLFLSVTFGSAPTADTVVECWMVRGMGDGNYEDGSTATIVPRNGFLGNFTVRAVTTAQVMCLPNVMLPATDFKLLLINKTNQNFPANGSTLKAVPYKLQVA